MGAGAQGGPGFQQEEHLYAELDFSEENKHPSVESVYATAGLGELGRSSPLPQQEAIYAPQKPTGNPKDTEFQARANPLYQGMGAGAQGGQGFQQKEHLYAELDFSEKSEHSSIESVYATAGLGEPGRSSPPPQQEAIYAPQQPIGNPYDRPNVHPTNGRRATKLVDPYAVRDLNELEKEQESQILENPLYQGMGAGAQGGQDAQQEEHLYAELDFSEKSEHSSIESVYATAGMGEPRRSSPLSQQEAIYAPQQPIGNPYDRPNVHPTDGRRATKLVDPYAVRDLNELEKEQESQILENPLYQGIGAGAGRITPPPRSPQDEIRTKMAQHPGFQCGVREVQEWCLVVYGDRHVLNQQLAEILNNPQQGDKALLNLLEDPEGSGKLAGQKLLGMKNLRRREAEEGFHPLCSALERHIEGSKKLHRDLTREQERRREHESSSEYQEYSHQHHHRHHHSRERGQDSPEQHARGRHSSEQSKGGMAFSM
ncbi:BID domain-containing T4SS effector [Bartonella raoultii]|uniref:BID domain-containing T4SS effector n=1 Tax=Bartonella raoultii TaxID=1457020 RepID=UPI001ABA2843|nr:BID domain-containing T4SS effector [Bartonella raoultii]